MRKVKNKNTNIELLLRKRLWKDGHHYRLKNKLFGKPDLIYPRQKIAIFCDGDFWHGKNYDKENVRYKKFWKEKILTNMLRDRKVNKFLISKGWRVLRFWKTDILQDLDKCTKIIEKELSLFKTK